MTWIATAALVLALGPAGLRWLRVAQREHYLPGSCTRFALRWWAIRPESLALGAVALAGVVLSAVWPLVGLATAVAVVLGPLQLGVRGRTSSLVATRRLQTLAAVWIVLQAAVVVIGVALGAPAVAAALGAVLVPVLVDVALLLTAPHERRLAARFVATASTRLQAVHPTVVAVTGSYGKTSTKQHIAHLVEGTRPVVATPASFNNRAGLARAINENLVPGTEVFVAEMGTYGPGEIAELCRWCPPDISVITAIGPVHLERFGSEDRIVQAKSEILEGASTAVLNVDDDRLAALADRLDAAGAPAVVRATSSDVRADVEGAVEDGGRGGGDEGAADVRVRRRGDRMWVEVGREPVVGELPVGPGVRPSNVACAVGVALGLGVPIDALAGRLATLPAVANRLTAGAAPSGVVVLDDTYNSNPAGARAALDALAALADVSRRVVVTPGMVELGRRQAEENESFAAAAARVATDLVVVGRTNRRALVRGWTRGPGGTWPLLVDTRQDAVAWVRQQLGPGHAVLYENDLPDHYP